MSSSLQSTANAVVISVREVDKVFEMYSSPTDRLKQFILPRLGRLFGLGRFVFFKEFVALKGISFEVSRGETVGIIGRNGAGKSTLLQILCGTLSPSRGIVSINGRVAALLELGSGFNSDFTGRENIRINAGILGLTTSEIDDRFDAIVAFADIGEFIDQPVKTYSSGMYVRLAFSVVIHVEAQILIIDEALAVGDMYFQAKCMAKLKQLMESGITVLFVSHDISAVKALCNRVIYLDHGKLVYNGSTDSGVEAYYTDGVRAVQGLNVDSKPSEIDSSLALPVVEDRIRAEFSSRAGFQRVQNGAANFINVQLIDDSGMPIQHVDAGKTITVRMVFETSIPIPLIGVAYHIRDKNGFDLVYSDTSIERVTIANLHEAEKVQIDWMFKLNLREGDYTIAAMLSIPLDLTIGKVEVCDFIPIASQIKVNRGSRLPHYGAVFWENVVDIQRSKLKDRSS